MLDKYEILQKIGDGGMATVYRGRHVTLGRDVAIKVMHPHLSASPRNRQRFAREARAIEHLDHDNILKIFDYSGTDTDDCFIVTEFVDGLTLQALVAEHGALPSEIVAMLGIRLADALTYAHGLGIIHRDLKPENVMIRRDGTVKLMDFGIARFLDEINLTMTGALVGSPAYMSPEQAMERVLDLRSDLFSMGTLLFHLVTGQLPFAGSNPSIILRNIIEGKRPELMDLAPHASARLADLVERTMATDPAGRPASAAEVRAGLIGALEEVNIKDGDGPWRLQLWLADHSGYEARLQAHLSTALLARGRQRLQERDHLSALQLFNRLLCIDEDNTEVLELIQGMHGDATPAGRPRRWWLSVAVLLLVSGGVSALMWPRAPAPPATTPAGDEDLTGPDVEPDRVDDAAPPLVLPSGPAPEVPVGAPEPEAPAGAPPTAPIVRRLVRPDGSSGQRRPDTSVAAAIAPSESATITVVVPGSWGYIYVDGQMEGRTGKVGAISVTPGVHTLRVENDYSMPWTERFEVHAGEAKDFQVTGLQRKPVFVRLTADLVDDCEVEVDGQSQGTVEQVMRVLRLAEPDKAHEVRFLCPEGDPIVRQIAPTLPGAVLSLP